MIPEPLKPEFTSRIEWWCPPYLLTTLSEGDFRAATFLKGTGSCSRNSSCAHAFSMPICIECRYPVPQLYHILHSSNKSHKSLSNATSNQKAAPIPSLTDRDAQKHIPSKSAAAGGADVRLTQCPRCKRFADKYVEHDFVVLFIDLVLVKPQVGPA